MSHNKLNFSALGETFFVNSGSVVVLHLDLFGTILAANPHAQTFIGKPLIGESWHTLFLHFGEKISFADWLANDTRPRLLNVHTATGAPQTLHITVELAGDNYVLFGELNAAEQTYLSQQVLSLNNEQNQSTRELAIKNAELAQLSALKNQFLGMASHDLRKPIGLVLSYAEFLMDEAGTQLSAEHQDFLQTIIVAADRMRRVVDDFLDVSLIEAGRFNLDEQWVDLASLVSTAVTLVNVGATKRGVRINTNLNVMSGLLCVDGAKIEQVLINLLSNAVEHSPIDGCVIIDSQCLSTELRVQVTDTGTGISVAQQKQLFQSFASGQTQKSTGERSIGLGLAIARKIVEAHGGRMFVESEMGHGSVFGFTLPLSRLSGNIRYRLP